MHTPRLILFPALGAALLFSSVATMSAELQLLDGTWRFALDPADVGVAERWYARDLGGEVALPGTLPGQGIGNEVTVKTPWIGSIFDQSYFNAPEYAPYRQPGNIKVPFWLQPDRYYAGAAWFQRDVDIPAAWSGKRVVLSLERPHWKTEVWLDDRALGASDALSVPHCHDLGTPLTPGRHRLTIRVDNSLVHDIGINSHSITDHTQGNWNGIVGRIGLEAGAAVWAENVQVFPDVATRGIRVRLVLRNVSGQTAQGKISLSVTPGLGAAAITPLPVTTNFNTAADASPVELEMSLGAGASLWDEFSPALYRLEVQVGGVVGDAPFAEAATTRFGLREISADGRQLLVNGRRLFLRGTLECAIFPRTGHPPTDVESWRKLMRVVQAHGLNHIRFHSWCPPEAAFVAADELGVYLQVEAASWPNQSTTLGDSKPVDAWLDAETERILRVYGNHPSFVLMASSNEPGGPNANPWLSQWLKRWRAHDPRRLFTAGAGWPELPENQLHIRSEPRIQHWGEGLASRINALPPETRFDYRDFINERSVPVVSHEIGQWCVYPNFAEMPKYTGYLKPRNFEIFRDRLAAHGLLEQARDFTIASGKLQALCYKEDIESALRTPQMAGFQLLDLHDFPGQGTALVGVLDPFWEEKGYITAEEYRRFCNSTVPLARLPKRVFTQDESLAATFEVAHFGAAPLRASAGWKLTGDDGRVVASGTLPEQEIPVGGGTLLGAISVNLAGVPAPARYKLVVQLDGTGFENDWDIWVYPPADRVAAAIPSGVTIVRDLDAAALAAFDAGGTVLLMIPPDRVAPDPAKGKIALGFSSIFWNTAWTNGQAPHTLGILCDPQHPALARFPTEFHSNWQWWYPITRAAPMLLDGLPVELRPVVQVIDDWFTNRKLALVVEARVGRGRLLATSIDLAADDLDPVRRQLRTSLLAYMAGPQFAPHVTISVDDVRRLIVR